MKRIYSCYQCYVWCLGGGGGDGDGSGDNGGGGGEARCWERFNKIPVLPCLAIFLLLLHLFFSSFFENRRTYIGRAFTNTLTKKQLYIELLEQR